MRPLRIKRHTMSFLLVACMLLLLLPHNQAHRGKKGMFKKAASTSSKHKPAPRDLETRTLTAPKNESDTLREFLSFLERSKQGICGEQSAAEQKVLATKQVQRRHLHEMDDKRRVRHGRCRVVGCSSKATHGEPRSQDSIVCRQHKLTGHVLQTNHCMCSFPEG
jgi:hypothetical protein